jgi:hypothetical protein
MSAHVRLLERDAGDGSAKMCDRAAIVSGRSRKCGSLDGKLSAGHLVKVMARTLLISSLVARVAR